MALGGVCPVHTPICMSISMWLRRALLGLMVGLYSLEILNNFIFQLRV